MLTIVKEGENCVDVGDHAHKPRNMFANASKLQNDEDFDSLLGSLATMTSFCTIAISIGYWFTDYCFHCILGLLITVLAVCTVYDYFVSKPKAEENRRSAEIGIKSLSSVTP